MSDHSTKEKHYDESPPRPSSPVVGTLKDINNADAALDFLRHENDIPEMTAEDEKRLVRKIDWMIMPLMYGCYVLQYLDKVSFVPICIQHLSLTNLQDSHKLRCRDGSL